MRGSDMARVLVLLVLVASGLAARASVQGTFSRQKLSRSPSTSLFAACRQPKSAQEFQAVGPTPMRAASPGSVVSPLIACRHADARSLRPALY